ncbi:hypothetical protein JCM10449v2_002284 [Rhodotorula kratochvilovae]
MATYTGTCLCGQTRIAVKGPKSDSQVKCHCTDCQLTSGTSNSSNIIVKESDVEITGAVAKYVSKAASGNDVTRFFCGKCGSPFGHNSVVFGDSMAVQTGTLGGAFKDVPYGAELFVKDRWWAVAPELQSRL